MAIWRKMTSLWQMRVLLPIVVMMGLGLLVSIIPNDTLAQGPVLPTPTNMGEGGGSGGGSSSNRSKDDGGNPIPPGAAVSGFVYNYSSGAYEGGVTVAIEGDSWQTETVSDSNGYYRIGNLGIGSGVVNLRLPPDAHPVVFDWPVWFHDGADLRVDLGYYWGDDPPLPMLLSGNLENNILTVQVENRTSETSTGGVIEIETPGSIRISPVVEVSQGQVVDIDYDPHQRRIGVADLVAGAKTTVKVALKETAHINTDEAMPNIRVIFTYDQQHTPQLIEIDSNELSQALALIQSEVSVQQNSAAPSSVSASQPALLAGLTTSAQATPSPGSTPSAAQPTPTAQSSPSPQPTPTAESASSAQIVEPTLVPQQLPDTGGSSNTGEVVKLLLSVVIVMGLTTAGWWSLKAKF